MDKTITSNCQARTMHGLRVFCCVLLGLILLCSSCVSVCNKGIVKMYPSPNFNERKYPISMIVLHYTVIPTCEESLIRLSETTNEAGKVSAHYLVDRDGSTYNLVNESKRAWHAGLGSWAGLDDITITINKIMCTQFTSHIGCFA